MYFFWLSKQSRITILLLLCNDRDSLTSRHDSTELTIQRRKINPMHGLRINPRLLECCAPVADQQNLTVAGHSPYNVQVCREAYSRAHLMPLSELLHLLEVNRFLELLTQCSVVVPQTTNLFTPFSLRTFLRSVPTKLLLTLFSNIGSPSLGCAKSLKALP